MGTTYYNCQVRTDSQEAVVAALTGLLKAPAYVAPAVGGWVGIYSEAERTDPDTLAKKLSAKLACGVFFWSVYDSDIFFYTLYEDGKKRDEFDSNPDYFESVSAAKKARLCGKPETLVPYCLPGIGYSQVQEVLQPPSSPRPAENTFNSAASLEALPLLPGKSLDTLTQALEKLKQDIFQKTGKRYTFADEQASDLAKLLGIAEDLEAAEYRDIAEANGNSTGRQFRLVGNENLSQEYKNSKLWHSFRLEDLKSVVAAGADVNARDNQGVPLLVRMARYCAAEQIQYLISRGADVNAATLFPTPDDPHYAFHVQLGAILEDGVTALVAAAGASREHPPYQAEAIQILLNAGANVNARSEAGRTALGEAVVMTDWTKHQRKIGRIAPEEVLRQAAERSAEVVEMLRAAGATE